MIGSGVGGLLTAALLSRRGYRVCLLERHYVPGGYGQSFTRGEYTFCAQLHYLFNCGEEDDFGILLRRLGLEDEIRFNRLDPDGFDRLHFPSFGYEIVQGFDRNLERLAARYPEHRSAIARYFDVITRIHRELQELPPRYGLSAFLLHPLRFRNLIRYRNWTTEDLFEHLRLPLEVRSILAGQSGDLLLPPSRASLLVQSGLVCGYDAGAYVPAKSYRHLFETIADFINRQPGCRVLLKSWVTSLEVRGDRVVAARTKKGAAFEGTQFLYNGDPKLLEGLLQRPLPPSFRRKLDYEYSSSCFTLYLGLRDLDPADFGFGNWNVWHYAHDDVNRCYRVQLDQGRMEDPSLFLSTPTLHQKEATIAPTGCHQLIACTPCTFEYFNKLKGNGRKAYRAEKQRVAGLVLDQIERHYIPGLRKHLDLVVAATPSTHQRLVLAPEGNAYGANLTPGQIKIGKIDDRSPYENLRLVGATAGVPSFGGGVHCAIRLYEQLTGDNLRA